MSFNQLRDADLNEPLMFRPLETTHNVWPSHHQSRKRPNSPDNPMAISRRRFHRDHGREHFMAALPCSRPIDQRARAPWPPAGRRCPLAAVTKPHMLIKAIKHNNAPTAPYTASNRLAAPYLTPAHIPAPAPHPLERVRGVL